MSDVIDLTTTTKLISLDNLTRYDENIKEYIQDGLDEKVNVADISNPNLLINPDFTVNQYGTTTVEVSASDYSYICDCWKAKAASGTGSVTYESGNVTLGTGCAMIQRLENTASLNGMTLTLSAMVNGELINGSFVWDTTKNYATVTNGTVLLAYSGNARYIQVYNTSASDAVISSVKLEIGEVVTPFTPLDPTIEYARCQRYLLSLIQFSSYRAVVVAADYIDFSIPTPTTMRPISGISIINPENFEVRSINSALSQNDFSYSVVTYGANQLRLRATKTAHGLTDATLSVLTGTSVLLSAEL